MWRSVRYKARVTEAETVALMKALVRLEQLADDDQGGRVPIDRTIRASVHEWATRSRGDFRLVEVLQGEPRLIAKVAQLVTYESLAHETLAVVARELLADAKTNSLYADGPVWKELRKSGATRPSLVEDTIITKEETDAARSETRVRAQRGRRFGYQTNDVAARRATLAAVFDALREEAQLRLLMTGRGAKDLIDTVAALFPDTDRKRIQEDWTRLRKQRRIELLGTAGDTRGAAAND